MKTFRNLRFAILALGATALNAFAGDPTGTWTFQGEGPKGRSVETTLTLKYDNNQLSGTIDNRAGKVAITNAKFADDQVSFTVVRKVGRRLRKQTFTLDYRGRLEGDTIKGTIETTVRGDKPVSIPWEARRVK